jgi:hypothetical protein
MNNVTFPIEDQGQRVFAIFEGQCPQCGGELEEINAGGWQSDGITRKWYEYKCQNCNHISYVEATAGGDWASN